MSRSFSEEKPSNFGSKVLATLNWFILNGLWIDSLNSLLLHIQLSNWLDPDLHFLIQIYAHNHQPECSFSNDLRIFVDHNNQWRLYMEYGNEEEAVFSYLCLESQSVLLCVLQELEVRCKVKWCQSSTNMPVPAALVLVLLIQAEDGASETTAIVVLLTFSSYHYKYLRVPCYLNPKHEIDVRPKLAFPRNLRSENFIYGSSIFRHWWIR